MTTDIHYLPEDNNDRNAFEKDKTDSIREGVEISQPNDKEPVGPFEHSGETAGWTETEEKTEKVREQEAKDENAAE